MTKSDTHLSQRTLYLYGSGSAEFDEPRLELRVGLIAIELQRKCIELLAFVLARRGEVFTKEEVLEAVWPGMTIFVERVSPNEGTVL